MISEIRHWLRRLVRRVGWGAWATLAVIAAAVLLQLGFAVPARQKVAQLQDQIRRQALSARQIRPQDPVASASAELDKFYRFFPLPPATADLLRQVYAEAARHGVAVDRGDYQYAPENGLALARYRMNLPVRGDYRQIKAFVAAILDAQPNLSLDSIRFTREQVGAQAIEARLQFSLWVDNR